MSTLTSTPGSVYVLRVGRKFYFEPGGAGGVSVLRVFLTRQACRNYKAKIEPFLGSALYVDAVALTLIWDDLDRMHRDSMKYFSAPLRLVISHLDMDEEPQDYDVLWDATVTLH